MYPYSLTCPNLNLSGDTQPLESDSSKESSPEIEVKSSEEQTRVSTDIEEIDSFDDMGLKETLLRGIYGYGFDRPS